MPNPNPNTLHRHSRAKPSPGPEQETRLTRPVPAPAPAPRVIEADDAGDLAEAIAEEERELWPSRTRSSAIRYQQVYGQQPPQRPHAPSGDEALIIPARRSVVVHHGLPPLIDQPGRSARSARSAPCAAVRARPTTPIVARDTSPAARRWHWLVFVGGGMLVMLTLVLGARVGLSWWQGVQQQWAYGTPRTFQVDLQVGHGGTGTLSSHFIALNLDGRISILECPQEDCTHAVIYTGPQLYGSDAADTPVTLSFADVNGDGKLDMIVHLAGQTFVFVNTGTQFRPATPQDHVTLPAS